MSTHTPNINLEKPSGNERPYVSVINSNSDILDSVIGEVDVEEDGSLQEQIDGVRESVDFGKVHLAIKTVTTNTGGFASLDLPTSNYYVLCAGGIGISCTPLMVNNVWHVAIAGYSGTDYPTLIKNSQQTVSVFYASYQ